MPWDGKIPYVDGTPMRYVWNADTARMWHNGAWRPVEFRDNEPFVDTLLFTRFGRGRSAAYAMFTSARLGEVTMFLTDLEDVLKNGLMHGGYVSGRFKFCKRGQNFGIVVT